MLEAEPRALRSPTTPAKCSRATFSGPTGAVGTGRTGTGLWRRAQCMRPAGEAGQYGSRPDDDGSDDGSDPGALQYAATRDGIPDFFFQEILLQ